MPHNAHVLLTAFQGTSSETLLRRFGSDYAKLILVNHKDRSVNQLISALREEHFDYVFSFGQKPVIRDKIYLELQGRLDGRAWQTTLDPEPLASALKAEGFPVTFSANAGTSFCNHLYASGLNHIAQTGSGTGMMFLHIPFAKNISDFPDFSERLFRALEQYLSVSK